MQNHNNDQNLPQQILPHQINLESSLKEFQLQIYPTVEETISNNKNIIQKRKKFFLQNLKESFQLIEFLLIVILYLRDFSFLKLIIRCSIHLIIININPEIFKYNQLQNNNMNVYIQGMIKMSLKVICYGNIGIILLHLIFSPASPGTLNRSGDGFSGFSNGGLTVQFIGERLPYNRFELIALDLLCFFIQLLMLYIIGIVDNSHILGLQNQLEPNATLQDTTTTTENVQPQNNQEEEEEEEEEEEQTHRHKLQLEENDGYNGNVMLLTIDLIKGIEIIMNIKINLMDSASRSSLSSSTDDNSGFQLGSLPGAFPSAGSMV